MKTLHKNEYLITDYPTMVEYYKTLESRIYQPSRYPAAVAVDSDVMGWAPVGEL